MFPALLPVLQQEESNVGRLKAATAPNPACLINVRRAGFELGLFCVLFIWHTYLILNLLKNCFTIQKKGCQ
jgi:hypothetical protein